MKNVYICIHENNLFKTKLGTELQFERDFVYFSLKMKYCNNITNNDDLLINHC